MQPFKECVACDPQCSSRVIAWRTDDLGFYWHQHPEAEIVVHVAGTGTRHVGDFRGPFRPGQACLFSGGLPHALTGDEQHPAGQHHVALQFDAADVLKRLTGQPEAQDLERILRAGSRGLLVDGPVGAQLCQVVRDLEGTTGLPRFAGLLNAMQLFASAIAEPLASPLWQQESTEQHPLIATLSSWLAEHATEPIGLAEAAVFVGMSPSACARLFRRYTGHSIVGWLNHVRVGLACNLLRDTDRKIVDIGLDAGFGNQANFNRIFRTLVKQTPREYRTGYRDKGAVA